MTSIFSKIIQGEIPSYKVYEDDEFFAFLDINPVMYGHVLVIPKIEIDYIFDMQDDALSRFILCSKIIAVELKKKVPCRKVSLSVIGLEVSHAHIHLVPINHVSDLKFGTKKSILEEDQEKLAFALFNSLKNNYL